MDFYNYCIENQAALEANDMNALFDGLSEEDIHGFVEYLNEMDIDILENVPKLYNGMCKEIQLKNPNIKLNNNVTTIGFETFCGSNVKSVYIPASCTWIDFNAFKDCGQLETVVFDKNCTIEGASPSAFENCPNLKDVYLPDSEFKIHFLTFYKCPQVINIHYYKKPLMSKLEPLHVIKGTPDKVTGIPEECMNYRDHLNLIQNE